MKNWKEMTKEEKLTRIFAMKSEGYTNREIGDFYCVSEDAIKKTLQRSQKGTKRTLEEINDTPVKVEITMDTISPFLGQLLERIESLELEVASVKKLQVESASIELLEETEFKYFVFDRNTEELLKKFSSEDDCLNYLSNLLECRLYPGYLESCFRDKYEIVFKGKYLVRKSLDKDLENIKHTTNFMKAEYKDIYKELEEIKNTQNL